MSAAAATAAIVRTPEERATEAKKLAERVRYWARWAITSEMKSELLGAASWIEGDQPKGEENGVRK